MYVYDLATSSVFRPEVFPDSLPVDNQSNILPLAVTTNGFCNPDIAKMCYG
jgi:hypothetical protein